MRIGIDGRALQGNRTGIGRYVFNLCMELDRLLPDVTFFVYSNVPLQLPILSELNVLDPTHNKLVLITKLSPNNDPYHRLIYERINSPKWTQNVTVTGHLGELEVAKILASADAVVLPFLHGLKERNGSYLASIAQGTFTVTTSESHEGYVQQTNTYFLNLGFGEKDLSDVLHEYAGRRFPIGSATQNDWNAIALAHRSAYTKLAYAGSLNYE